MYVSNDHSPFLSQEQRDFLEYIEQHGYMPKRCQPKIVFEMIRDKFITTSGLYSWKITFYGKLALRNIFLHSLVHKVEDEQKSLYVVVEISEYDTVVTGRDQYNYPLHDRTGGVAMLHEFDLFNIHYPYAGYCVHDPEKLVLFN